jgi:epoxyqueuosine reductase QueG
MAASATSVIRSALKGSGIEAIASCGAVAYDACAPEPLRSRVWLRGARGVVVAGSAGPALWRGFRARMQERPELWASAHPYDEFVGALLARADQALREAGVRFRRFEAAFGAPVRVDFVALGRLVGMGSPGPFGLLIHPEHGPWWALRGAWIVDAAVDAPIEPRQPCAGCSAPCVGGWSQAAGILQATAEVRGRCVIGQASRYDDDQVAYHYDRAATAARLQKEVGPLG